MEASLQQAQDWNRELRAAKAQLEATQARILAMLDAAVAECCGGHEHSRRGYEGQGR